MVVHDENVQNKPNGAKIMSQLSRDLTSDMLEHEVTALGKVSFPLKQKQVASMAA